MIPIRISSLVRVLLALVVLTFCFAALSNAQTPLPPPTNPLAFCVAQTGQAPDTYTLVFDGGAPEAVTVQSAATAPAAVQTYCAAIHPTYTHAFTQPAARFPIRQTAYTLVLRGTNPFGTTAGPSFSVLVGVAPGPATILGVGQLPE